MLKFNFKLLVSLFITFLLLFSCSYATEITNSSNIIDRDLYVSDVSNYDFSSTVDGSAFISTDSFILNSSNNGGIIKGNLFIVADEIKLSSDVVYITDNDDTSVSNIEQINSSSIIYGNAFVVAKKFIMEAGAEINGDLFITASEINLNSKSTVYGNVFANCKTLNMNGVVANNVYANCENFNMGYDGIINKTLNLSAENAIINGLISKDSNISAKAITVEKDYVNYGNIDFSAEKITFSGQIGKVASPSNVSLKSKELTFLDSSEVSITGNLNYSTNKEMDLSNIVSGEISFSEYKENTSVVKNIFNSLLGLVSNLLGIIVIYFIITKIFNVTFEKSNFNIKKLFICLGIGTLLIIFVPILFILLCVSRIGVLLAFILLILYILIVILATPLFVIYIANIFNNKFNNKLSTLSYILIITFILWLTKLIPGVNIAISILLFLIGSGSLCLLLCKKD